MKSLLKLSLPALVLFSSLSWAANATPEKIVYSFNGQDHEGFILRTPAKGPAILMIHNWMGVTPETETQAQRFRALGYTVMAADVYGKGVRPTNPGDAGKQAGLYKGDREMFRKDLQAALETLKKEPNVDPSRIAVVGYCFGGTGALELARSGAEIRATISFHGGLDSLKSDDAKNIKGKVLVLHGAEDPFNPKKDVEAFISEMKDHHVDYTFVAYPGAVHSFTEKAAGNDNTKGAAYNAKADKASFEKATAFLKKAFK